MPLHTRSKKVLYTHIYIYVYIYMYIRCTFRERLNMWWNLFQRRVLHCTWWALCLVAVCCSMLQYVAVRCRVIVFESTWAHRAAISACLDSTSAHPFMNRLTWCSEKERGSVLQCVAVCVRVLKCVAVCCSVLQCVAVFCTSPHESPHMMLGEGARQCVAVCCSVRPCVAVCCSVLQCVAVCCSVLHIPTWIASNVAWRRSVLVRQCVAVCCSVLQCIAVCCSVLQCVAVCCSVLHIPTWIASKVARRPSVLALQCAAVCCSMLQCVAVFCSVSQYGAVCCSVLQCVAVCCSMLQCVAVSERCLAREHLSWRLVFPFFFLEYFLPYQ